MSQQLDRLTDAYLQSIIPLPEYERRRRELGRRDQALAEQEVQLSAQAERHEETAGLALAIDDFCARVRTGLANANFEQTRQLIELLVDRVIVTDTEVEIRDVIPTHPRSEHVRFCHLRTDYFHGPHVVRPGDLQTAQQVREDPVLWLLSAGVRAPVQRFDPHLLHQRGHVPSTNLQPVLPQQVAQHAGAGERVVEVQLIHPPIKLRSFSETGWGV